jgi:alkaline phosphatase D
MHFPPPLRPAPAPAWRGLPGALAASLALALVAIPASAYDAPPEPGRTVSRVAFGSCNSPSDTTAVWQSVLDLKPDVWIWLGDTVYADSPRPLGPTEEARARVSLDRLPYLYGLQNAIPAYARLRSFARIIGTWDDHDYGMNDAGADFVGKIEAQRHFMDFYGEPVASPRRGRPGVYSSYRFGPDGRRVQVILLDTRYFRSPLLREDNAESHWVEGRPGSYRPSSDPATTLLGEDQWRWLEAALRQPADVRLLVSSIQVIADCHRFEKWGNFPHERRRLFRLIRETGASGVVMLSGDRHTGELSRLDPLREPDGAVIDPGYPLYDLTSSALTRSAPTTFAGQLAEASPKAVVFSNELNRHRVGSRFPYDHFGLVDIDWDAPAGAEIRLALYTDLAREVLRARVPLADLRRR